MEKALRAMEITSPDRTNGHYFAANDCLRCLVVLSLLLSTDSTFDLSPQLALKKSRKEASCYDRMPKRSPKRFPNSTHIVTEDRSLLPLQYSWPLNLVVHFKDHEFKAVGTNMKSTPKGVRVWWFAFHTSEAMEKFKREVNGMVLEGVKLRVAKERDKAPPSLSVKPRGQYENLGAKEATRKPGNRFWSIRIVNGWMDETGILGTRKWDHNPMRNSYQIPR